MWHSLLDKNSLKFQNASKRHNLRKKVLTLVEENTLVLCRWKELITERKILPYNLFFSKKGSVSCKVGTFSLKQVLLQIESVYYFYQLEIFYYNEYQVSKSGSTIIQQPGSRNFINIILIYIRDILEENMLQYNNTLDEIWAFNHLLSK